MDIREEMKGLAFYIVGFVIGIVIASVMYGLIFKIEQLLSYIGD